MLSIPQNLLNFTNFTQTPHSGYHWDGSSRRFFEGWYYRVTLPEIGQTIAFMYSMEDPIGNQPYSGGAAQILGINDEYLCRTFPDVKKFWASRDVLGLGHWGKTNLQVSPLYLIPSEFTHHIQEGYQATATLNQGIITDPATGNYCDGSMKLNLYTLGAMTTVFSNQLPAGYHFPRYLNQVGKF